MYWRAFSCGLGLCAVTCGVDLAPLESGSGGSGGVNGDASSGGGAGTGGSAGSSVDASETGSPDAEPIEADAAPLGCTECFANVCTQELAACQANASCKQLMTCLSGCTTTSCEASCINNSGQSAGVTWYNYSSCLSGKCLQECGLLGVPSSVGCVKSTCTLPGQKCCINPLLLQFGGASCKAAGTSCDANASLRCDGPEDCPGQKCCATYQGSGELEGTRCQNSCTWPSLTVCGAATNACPAGYACGAGPLRLCQSTS